MLEPTFDVEACLQDLLKKLKLPQYAQPERNLLIDRLHCLSIKDIPEKWMHLDLWEIQILLKAASEHEEFNEPGTDLFTFHSQN